VSLLSVDDLESLSGRQHSARRLHRQLQIRKITRSQYDFRVLAVSLSLFSSRGQDHRANTLR